MVPATEAITGLQPKNSSVKKEGKMKTRIHSSVDNGLLYKNFEFFIVDFSFKMNQWSCGRCLALCLKYNLDTCVPCLSACVSTLILFLIQLTCIQSLRGSRCWLQYLGHCHPGGTPILGTKKKGKKRLKNKDYTRCKLGFNAFHTGVFLNITPNCEARALRG